MKLRYLLAPLLFLLMAGCDIDQTREARMPDVDVKGGQLPEYEVEGPDVEVTSERAKMRVPDVDVDMEEREIEVPNIDVDIPEENEQ